LSNKLRPDGDKPFRVNSLSCQLTSWSPGKCKVHIAKCTVHHDSLAKVSHIKTIQQTDRIKYELKHKQVERQTDRQTVRKTVEHAKNRVKT